jgi:hypothetical protein
MNQNPTPGKAARKWAKQYPGFTGILEVLSHTRKGRGGWKGLATRTNVFFVRDGKVRQRRDGRGHVGFNGVCEVCGQVYLDTVLAWAHGSDPRAGQPVPDAELWNMYKGEEAVYHDRATVRACPACVEVHGLEVRWMDRIASYEKPLVWVGDHPLRQQHDTPKETLDIRD